MLLNDLSFHQSAALTEGKSNSTLDVTKFVLCIMIVAIHTQLTPRLLNPWLKMAVPLFFIMSSYFLWKKLLKCQNTKEQGRLLRDFVKRNAILYGFWSLFWSPVILIYRQYFSDGIVFGLLRIARSFLFSSTFIASWFIPALVLSSVCVFYLSRVMSDKLLFLASLILHILIVLSYTYYPADAISATPPPSTNLYYTARVTLRHYYELIFTSPVNSFPVAFFWVVCGKCFANPSSFLHMRNISRKIKPALTVLFLALLYAEWLYVSSVSGAYDKTPYFMLAPACVFLFDFLLNLPPVYFAQSVVLRKMSILIYVTHGSVLLVVKGIFAYALHITLPSVALFCLTLLVCLSMCACVLFLEKRKRFAWLKYVR